MQFHYESWTNKSVEEVRAYFLDYQNINHFTPSWMKFSVLGVEGDKVKFQVKTPLKSFIWTSSITQFESGFKDRLLTGPFVSFTHTHEFFPFEEGTCIRDRLEITCFRSSFFNKLVEPFLKLGLRLAFRDREKKVYDLLMNKILKKEYIPLQKRIDLTSALFKERGDIYILMYVIATRLLYRFRFFAPKEYDLINNQVAHKILGAQAPIGTQKEKVKTYLFWEQKTIISPLFYLWISKRSWLKRVICRFFFYINFDLGLYYFTWRFHEESVRMKFSMRLFEKLVVKNVDSE